jgi:hypothetical protein
MRKGWIFLRVCGSAAKVLLAMLATVSAVCVGKARADEAITPLYGTVLAVTTLATSPDGSDFENLPGDITPLVGLGYTFSNAVSVELDLGPTFVDGDYASFGLIPGVLWAFHKNVYLSARGIVQVDPEFNFAVLPGVGVTAPVAGGIAPYLEIDLQSFVGKGDPDLSVVLSFGVLMPF